MTRTRRSATTIDSLFSGYGHEEESPDLEQVLGSYYGDAVEVQSRATAPAAPVVAQSFAVDDGEVLVQKPQALIEEYVVAGGSTAPVEEYVVSGAPAPASADSAPTPLMAAAQAPPLAPAPSAELPRPPALPSTPGGMTEPAATAPPAPAAAAAPTTPAAAPKSRDMSEDELAADMAAILSGEKVFDPVSKATVPRDQLGQDPAPPPPRPVPDAPNEQAIFDRIAQSMQYANAYDLGTVELENRFADFDRIAELRDHAEERVATPPPPVPAAPAAPPVGKTEFIQDLDEIRRGEQAAAPLADPIAVEMAHEHHEAIEENAHATCKRPALSLSSDDVDGYSRPFYDAGEHVLAGGDLYVDQLRLGPNPGVNFSYGQIIGLAGDLYDSVDAMMRASASELTTLKALIDRNTAYYRGNKANRALDVSNAEWDRVTGGRYLRLAEDNYDHFAPNTLFNDAVSRGANRHGNHKSAWEDHHEAAIKEAQRLSLLPENANRSYVPESALIMNAFADHFLTDAFASGHLINKEVMIAKFRQNFFSGSSLNSAGKAFFGQVAQQAFVGRVAEKFSALETTDYPVCAWGWCLKWHPNINSVSRFTSLLVAAAEQQPVKIGNFVAKALHDRLNSEGLEVTNDAGDGTWTLHGDGYLNARTLGIMRKAVQQSVDNINDPAIQASNLNFSPFFAKVWKYTPKPTAASRTKLINLVNEYTNPNSATLATAAARIITDQVDSMIEVLLREGKLQRA